jgi:hypothetical protein
LLHYHIAALDLKSFESAEYCTSTFHRGLETQGTFGPEPSNHHFTPHVPPALQQHGVFDCLSFQLRVSVSTTATHIIGALGGWGRVGVFFIYFIFGYLNSRKLHNLRGNGAWASLWLVATQTVLRAPEACRESGTGIGAHHTKHQLTASH